MWQDAGHAFVRVPHCHSGEHGKGEMAVKREQVASAFVLVHIAVAHETLGRLAGSRRIYIAEINGHALGGGLEIALAARFTMGQTLPWGGSRRRAPQYRDALSFR